jgi:hypothetical protein
MLRTALLLFVVSLLAFTSCKKKTGSAKACFTFSKEKVKVGDTLYLLNCSENFKKFMWVSTVGPTLDSVFRHSMVIPMSTGTYDVLLYVGDYEFSSADYTKADMMQKSFTVE